MRGHAVKNIIKKEKLEMAVWGIGANLQGSIDISDDFINRKIAYLGYKKEDASVFYEMLKEVALGDIVYIKSLPIGGSKLHIKNVGIVTRELSNVVQYIDGDTKNDTIGVKWLDLQMDLDIEMCDKKYTARSTSIYQEYSPFVIDEIITRI